MIRIPTNDNSMNKWYADSINSSLSLSLTTSIISSINSYTITTRVIIIVLIVYRFKSADKHGNAPIE